MKDEDDVDIMENGMDDVEEEEEDRRVEMKIEPTMNRKQRKNVLCLLILWMCLYGLSTYHHHHHHKKINNNENERKTEWMDALESLLWNGSQSWWILCMCATCSWYVWETQLQSSNKEDDESLLVLLYSLLEVKPHQNNNKRMYQVCLEHTLDGYLRWSLCWFWYQFITLVLQTYYFPNNNNNDDEITQTTIMIRFFVSMIPVGMSIVFVIQSMKPIFLDTYYVRMVQAPFVSVTFMDGFIADVCTSMIWPCIHTVTSLSTLFLQPLTGSSQLLVHTYILPVCRITPLWWRFAQCLRTCYDTQQRWPQLGNAFKYMMTAHISLYYGIRSNTTEEVGGHYVWYLTWIGTTMYQLMWDIQMDWNLFSSSERKLRKKQLYSSPSWYYIILGLNTILRFGWTWSYLPFPLLLQQRQLGRSSFLLSLLEIIRRMIWGWIRVEWELLSILESDDNDNNDSFRPMMTSSTWHQHQQQQNDFSIIMELGLWATAFTTLSIFAAMHE